MPPIEISKLWYPVKYKKRHNIELTDEDKQLMKEYYSFKSQACSENNIPILIDDRIERNSVSCVDYSIVLIHPDNIQEYI